MQAVEIEEARGKGPGMSTKIKKGEDVRHNPDGTVRKLTWDEWFDQKIAELVPNNVDDAINLLVLPRPLAVFILFFFFIGSWALIIYYTWSGVDSAMNTYYMSLDGTDDVQQCWEVPAVVTGTYYADAAGNWGTDDGYSASRAVFRLDFLGTSISSAEYSATMAGFQASMKVLGGRSQVRDLSWNLMAWSTVNYVADNGMSFYTTADLAVVFDGLQVVSFTTYSWQGECVPTDSINNLPMKGAAGGLSSDGKMLVFSYDFGKVDGSPRAPILDPTPTTVNHYIGASWSPCESQWNPMRTWTYSSDAYEYSNFLNLKMEAAVDIRSLFTAVAVNFGVVSLEHLTEVKTGEPSLFNSWLQNDFPDLKYYVDPFYTPMEPIACVPPGSENYFAETGQLKTQFVFCLVPVNGNFVYPVVWGKSSKKYSSRDYCECDILSTKTKDEQSLCHAPYFQIAIVYDKVDVYEKRNRLNKIVPEAITWPVFSLAAKYSKWMTDDPELGDTYIMDEVQKVLAPLDSNSKIQIFQKTPTGAMGTGLCVNNDCGVGVWTIHPKATQMESAYITKDALQLKDLSQSVWTDAHGYTKAKKVACEDTLYTPQIPAWVHIVATPPVSLVQPYNQCSTKLFTAISNSFGNATSTAGTYMFLMVLLILTVSKKILNWSRSPENKIRRPIVQRIYDQEQQEIQQAKLCMAFKKLIEIGKFPAEVKEFKDFLLDWEARQSDEHFNLEAINRRSAKRQDADFAEFSRKVHPEDGDPLVDGN